MRIFFNWDFYTFSYFINIDLRPLKSINHLDDNRTKLHAASRYLHNLSSHAHVMLIIWHAEIWKKKIIKKTFKIWGLYPCHLDLLRRWLSAVVKSNNMDGYRPVGITIDGMTEEQLRI